MEIWKPVPGYEGYYEVSDLGSIRSVDRTIKIRCASGLYDRKLAGHPIAQTLDGRGLYLMVMLSRDGQNKKHLVHRLVAQAFIENPYGLPEINHKDENKRNNCVSNLEWCTHKYNNTYGSKQTAGRGEKNSQSKFSESVIRKLKSEYIKGDPEFGTLGLSKKYGISISHVSAIIHGSRWGWL